ncbi:MAG: mercury resistance system periplasmic binding protein MerP [Proteobacteria bacterium]|jgi:mercuric ion binding protein|nr:mercury resistance system periplasmic binding protein MerP [Pseudomonadota bacterium]
MRQAYYSTAFVLGLTALSGAASAAPRTVTLSVPSMTCSACPITVKTALQRVDGVQTVAVTYEPKEAVVTFDDARTTVAKLREATANAGFPSLLKAGK